jgi:DNA repair exonuclease SbcCD ATPase subunit
MEDKVRALFTRVRDAAQAMGTAAESTARYAGQKAGSIFDVTKLNMQIYELNNQANGLLRDAGQIIYDVHLGVESNEEQLSSILSQLDETNAQIMELRERIASLKSLRECPVCGAPCGLDDRFCKSCGTSL